MNNVEVSDLTAKALELSHLIIGYESILLGFITLDFIEVPEEKRNLGYGKRAMGKICAFADQRGLDIKLFADDSHGTSISDLIMFYSKFGFELDSREMTIMIRKYGKIK